ncbi:Uncharacterised protein [Mycobacteroides abscessus subsp. abscessus]|nr:Uncharacterised protein [Mycobacteroides abscessus subsp. abscessus]
MNKSPVETYDTSSGWKPRCGIMARQNPYVGPWE